MTDPMTIPELEEIHKRITIAMTEPARLVIRHLIQWCDWHISECDRAWQNLDSEDKKGLIELQSKRSKMVEVKTYLESHIRSPRSEDNPEGPDDQGE